MALVTCAECSNQISDQAMTCPHCGVSLSRKDKLSRWLSLALVLVVAGAGVAYFLSRESAAGLLDVGTEVERLTNEETIALRQMVRRSSVRVLARHEEGRAASGSGFVVRRVGGFAIVLTNAHVVTDKEGLARRIDVQAANRDSFLEAYPLRVLQDGQSLDYAFLVVPDPNAALGQEIQLATSVREGEYVLAVGSPLDEEFLVDDGNIVDVSPSPTGTFISHSALIEQGSSGGGLFNSRGELVGVNTFLSGDGETGIAIASEALNTRIFHVRVDGAGDWQDSGILVGPDEREIAVLALGEWRIGLLAGLVPPAGSRTINGRSITDEAAHGALLARMGPDGQIFGIDRWWTSPLRPGAASRNLPARSSRATIRFRANDMGQSDNTGFLDVILLMSE